MGESAINIQQLTQMAYSALQSGNNVLAKSLFEQITASDKAETPHWLGLAYASFNLGDEAATAGAVDQALELHPQNLRAIILKADLLKQQGQSRQSLKYYQYALRLAENAQNIPADITQGLARAEEVRKTQVGDYRSFLMEQIESRGFTLNAGNRRFQQSLELMLGEKEIYYQNPSRFYYPALPQIQFYEREQFDWVAEIESRSPEIRTELTAVMNDPSRFSPYVKKGGGQLGRDNKGLEDNDDWSALFLWDYGRLVTEVADLFPNTLQALEAAPLPHITDQAPMALFSKLAADTQIPPHNGLLNTRLICHLPLVVPENCGALRVGNEQRAWAEGELLIFDDSIEHEAWNSSGQERVILLFEIWRPELNEEERQLITTLLEAVKAFNEG
ncbi:MAG: aspartyl beta-hydroxylase [Xanthomonadales bacterium]|nr:aspartyl/asparaginyl beta-hydroxylase domain-containing protein [Gammaproteobacteria bacterium]NND55780.1 aspartyl beta-hydroxylase [Xanthomonadales bacterium]